MLMHCPVVPAVTKLLQSSHKRYAARASRPDLRSSRASCAALLSVGFAAFRAFVPAPAPTHPAPMNAPERKSLARGAVAGLMLLSSLLLCGLLGALVGALTGAVGICLALGIFIGFVVGVAAVRARFPDL